MPRGLHLLAMTVVVWLVGCTIRPPAVVPTATSTLHGTILIDGSSTVAPISQAIAEQFAAAHPDVQVNVHISGTGGGFKKFCAGATDISDASRPISAQEWRMCRENGIAFIELPVAFDGLSVVVHPTNDWAICLTVDELRRIWTPEAEGVITNWQQIRDTFPNRPLTLYGAGLDSGTYDYFTQAILGQEGVSRLDYFGSEDDNKLVQGVAQDPNALGFFGYAYYDQNRDKLKLLSIDNGRGCVEPNTETVSRGLYQPLSRPIFIYVNKKRLHANPALAAFVDFYIQQAPVVSLQVGYIPLTDQLYALVHERFTQQIEGSIFDGSGALVGVSIVDLLASEATEAH